ncbi:hypothetical protein NON00_12465 [Roseomonas sp. GC11]|uniref:hypothetical protein n=1 Tax=Roseomonas sp. GC11 TaxID=2950546 RepID=UPI00210AB034|nr:hypothetical protein [Roseomonas sp. GC11]MCQ4160740.1 hypothetical protein [Roseomonas sp. GC11]
MPSRYTPHALTFGRIAAAAPAVVQARLSLVAAQRRGPWATGLEMARMGPEKALAFSAGGAALAEGGARLSRLLLEHGLAEMEAGHRLWLRAATRPGPFGWAGALAGWGGGATLRSGRLALALGDAALAMTGAALAPVHRTVTGNQRRLR